MQAPLLVRRARPSILLTVCLLVFVAAICLIIVASTQHHRSSNATPGLIVAALLAITATGGTIWVWRAMRRGSLRIDSDGVHQQRVFGTSSIAWNEIGHYRYFSGKVNAGAAGGQGGLIGILVVAAVQAAIEHGRAPNRHFTLGKLKLFPRAGGSPVVINHKYENMAEVLERAFAELHPRLAQATDFAPFTVDPQALRHAKKGTLALAEIESVQVGGFNIRVRKRGKRLAWASIHMAQMNNSLMFLEQLATLGVVVTAASEVFVPDPVLAIFAATAARHSGLPQARIHKS